MYVNVLQPHCEIRTGTSPRSRVMATTASRRIQKAQASNHLPNIVGAYRTTETRPARDHNRYLHLDYHLPKVPSPMTISSNGQARLSAQQIRPTR
jgi:hypothetical protein